MTQSLVYSKKQSELIKEQLRNENDLKPSTTMAGRQEATKRQLSPPDQVFVNVSVSPYQPKNFESRQRPSRVRIQQEYFKQHGLNDLSGCIMTRDHKRRCLLPYCLKALQRGMLTSSNADLAFTKN